MAEGDGRAVAQATERRPSILVTGLMVAGVAPFMAGLFALYAVLGVGMQYVGFFFLLYWAGILHQELSQFLPSVIGAAGGLGLGWLLLTLTAGDDLQGKLAAGTVIASVLFCFMRGHLKLLCNNAMMLLLIVSTLPNLHVDKRVGDMIASLAVAAAYMVGVTVLINWLRAIASSRNETATETTKG